MHRAAVISPCQRFRYSLVRVWDPSKELLVFVMLNPSVANAEIDDPTVRKTIGFAERGGYGGVVIVNLYAFRATDPNALRLAGWPVGPENLRHIVEAVTGRDVVMAWGANVRHHLSAWRSTVEELLRDLARNVFVIKRLDDGVPVHPLMQPYSLGLNPA